MTTTRPVLLVACLGLMSALLTGCNVSRDAHVYESTPSMPMTVTIVDWTTGEELWALDVPVDRKLKIRFYDDRTARGASGNRQAMMRWEVMSPDKDSGDLNNEVAVPLAHSRRIDVSIRDVPEFATSGANAQPRTPGQGTPRTGEMLPSELSPRRSGGS